MCFRMNTSSRMAMNGSAFSTHCATACVKAALHGFRHKTLQPKSPEATYNTHCVTARVKAALHGFRHKTLQPKSPKATYNTHCVPACSQGRCDIRRPPCTASMLTLNPRPRWLGRHLKVHV